MRKITNLFILVIFFTFNLTPIMAQQKDFSTYPGAIRIHVKSFYKYLEKGKKDPKYWKDAERKVTYIKGKDAAVANELQTALDKVRGGAATTTKPVVSTKTSAKKEEKTTATNSKPISTANTTTTGTGDKSLDNAVKYFHQYLEKGKISNAETKLKYIEGKDAALASKLRIELEAKQQESSANKNQKNAARHVETFQKHLENARTAENLRTRAGALERAESSLKTIKKYDAAKATELRSLLEKEQGSLAAAEQAIEDNLGMYNKVNDGLKDLQSLHISSFGDGDYGMETVIEAYKNRVDAFVNDVKIQEGLAEIKAKTTPREGNFAANTFEAYKTNVEAADAAFSTVLSEQKKEATKDGNSPRIAYQKLQEMEGFWYAASKVFSENSSYSSHVNAVKSAMAGLGGKAGVEKQVKINDAKFLDSKRMAKAVATDPQLTAQFKQFFQKYKKATVGDAQRIVLLTSSWKMVKHDLTGLPLYKSQKAQIAAKEEDTGRCVLYELTLKQEFNGIGYEPIDIRSLYETMTIGCGNIQK